MRISQYGKRGSSPIGRTPRTAPPSWVTWQPQCKDPSSPSAKRGGNGFRQRSRPPLLRTRRTSQAQLAPYTDLYEGTCYQLTSPTRIPIGIIRDKLKPLWYAPLHNGCVRFMTREDPTLILKSAISSGALQENVSFPTSQLTTER